MVRRKILPLCMAFTIFTTMLWGCGSGEKSGESETKPVSQKDVATESQTEENPGLSTETEDTEIVAPPEVIYPEITSEEEPRKFDSVMVVGDAAYEYYTYVDDVAEDYAMAVKHVATALEGQSEVYNIVIPLSSGIVFPDNLRDRIDSSNQEEAMDKIQRKMGDKVKVVDIYDSLMSHRDEYIYFRTDHHWTAQGAYYAYEEFCKKKGIAAEPLDSYETMTFDGFLGSFYMNDTGKDAALFNHPDVVTAYLPKMDANMVCTDASGKQFASKVIYDETKAPAGIKYSCFIAGDNPYTEITNTKLKDQSACIVVKESFGNAFVPFLVDHYQTIYVVDYRYWTGSITELAAQKKVQDVIFINNLSMIRNKTLVGKLFRIV